MIKKYLVATVVSLFFIGLANSQSLKVTYAEKVNLDEKVKSITNPAYKKLILDNAGKPTYYELINHKGISIYKQSDNQNKMEEGRIIISFSGGVNEIFFRNHNNQTYTKQENFMTRLFLIEGKLQQKQWQLTDKNIKIGKYLCSKATYQKDSATTVTAWFTPEIPSNEGPKDYWGLPGLVLKIETKLFTIEATKINILKETPEIEKPKKGKKISQEDFDKMKKEKLDEMKRK